MAKKKYEKYYKYKCSITDEEFTLTKQAKNTDELMSVAAYYDLHPEEDDRPEHIKLMVQQEIDANLEQQAANELEESVEE